MTKPPERDPGEMEKAVKKYMKLATEVQATQPHLIDQHLDELTDDELVTLLAILDD